MSNKAKREYLGAVRSRYFLAPKSEKQKILDEFCANCHYNRKYAIRLINKKEIVQHAVKKPGRKKKYSHPDIFIFLRELWVATNLICSKRLKPTIPLWLPFYERPISAEVEKLLLEISAASIDRILEQVRKSRKKLGLSTTKPGSLIKKHVPIKTNQWDETKPGFIEADSVAHCGESVSGMFVYSINAVDIATGWLETRAVWGKGQHGCFNAIESIENSLPFKIRGFDSDNGGEFLNWHLHSYFTNRKHPVAYTRSRPYQKNDNAHVEGKNWTHIRQYLGYHRFEKERIVDLLNDLYKNEWRLFFNFFIPSSKIIQKNRRGSKITKVHDKPLTPYQRIMASHDISKRIKNELTRLMYTLNPFELQSCLVDKIKSIIALV